MKNGINKNNRKKVTMFATIALALITLISGTFAWFTATDSKVNHLKTADNIVDGVNIFEVFEEPNDWKPDQEITKNVGVINGAEESVLVRLSFDEALQFAKVSEGTSAAFNPASTTVLPVLFNNASITNTNGWYQLSTTPISGIAAGTPDRTALNGLKLDKAYTNLEVWITCVTTTGANPRTTYSLVAFAPITSGDYSGKKQKVTFDFEVDTTTQEVALDNIEYWQIEGRDTYTADWTSELPLAADIGYSIAESLAVTATTPGSPYGKYIEFNYAELASSVTAAKWIYNPDDGWFYYIGTVDSGKYSPFLLESLTLNKDADSRYANLLFDLTVNMEAIQCTESTVTSVFFGGVEPTAGSSLAIFTALKALCV